MEVDSSTTNIANPKSLSIFFQIVEHPDGTVTRPAVPLVSPADAESESNDKLVIFKDVPLDSDKNTWLRLYLPNPVPKDKKLPVVLYLHGGGFVFFSADFLLYHDFCEKAAVALPAIVVSLNYRLSPEHRLPAAYDDTVDALLWLQHSSTTDPWIASHGDLSRCFLAGSSCGGNMVYHAGLRASNLGLKLAGLVMIQPYFGGEKRTESENESEEDVVLPLRANETMWRLALPEGANKDHEYCNPAVGGDPEGTLLPRCLVTGCKGDPLFDRQREFVKMLQERAKGVEVVAAFKDHGYHAIELFEPAQAEELLSEIREFVYASKC